MVVYYIEGLEVELLIVLQKRWWWCIYFTLKVERGYVFMILDEQLEMRETHPHSERKRVRQIVEVMIP